MADILSSYDPSLARVSPSQISLWLECNKRWDWAYVEELVKVGPKEVYFEKGSYFHQIVHYLYQLMQSTGRQPGDDFLQASMQKRLEQELGTMTVENVGVVSHVVRMVNMYLAYHSPRIDKGIEVLGVEQHLEYPLELPNGRIVILQGYVDLIYRDAAKRLRIRDHKTGSNPSTWQSSSLDLELQLHFYAVVYWLVTGELPDLVEINFISTAQYKTKTASVDEMFKLLKKNLTEAALVNFKQYLVRVLTKMFTGEPGLHNYGKNCKSCPFKPLCELELNGLPTDRTIQSGYSRSVRSYSNRPGERPIEIVPEIDARDNEDFTISIPDVF